jgi:hypothetical protein
VRGASPCGAPLGLAVEVVPTTAALCAGGAAAVLPAGGGGARLWVSARARAGAEALARRALERLLGAPAPPPAVDREGAESAALWRTLGGAREADPADAGAAASEDSEGLETRLFLLEPAGGLTRPREVPTPAAEDVAEAGSCCLVDVRRRGARGGGGGLFLWQPARVDGARARSASELGERYLAARRARAGEPGTAMRLEREGEESAAFRAAFLAWARALELAQ